LRGVATCFGANVQLVPHEERVAVHWGYESVLVPQITCAKQALRSRGTWKYLVNLVGQDFPLRTNMELVAALKALNGSSLVESVELGNYASRTNNRSLPLGILPQITPLTINHREYDGLNQWCQS
uniref:NAD(P)-dependent oxidoreductase n=1 Tax=Mesocestoides corti TaxID=53468 RepID=A0A5K3FXB7_MESCO